MFFARVGKDAIVKTSVLPAVTFGVKKAASSSGLESVGNAPLAVLAPAIGCAFQAIKALMPL